MYVRSIDSHVHLLYAHVVYLHMYTSIYTCWCLCTGWVNGFMYIHACAIITVVWCDWVTWRASDYGEKILCMCVCWDRMPDLLIFCQHQWVGLAAFLCVEPRITGLTVVWLVWNVSDLFEGNLTGLRGLTRISKGAVFLGVYLLGFSMWWYAYM